MKIFRKHYSINHKSKCNNIFGTANNSDCGKFSGQTYATDKEVSVKGFGYAIIKAKWGKALTTNRENTEKEGYN